MCGLAGVFSAGETASRDLLLAMAGELSHRGPDGVGMLLHGPFGMVNTRLSIVDIDDGDQPLPDDSGRYWAMQNGEIYNHVELRAELSELGHSFRTRCDTEVIACAYAEWGVEFLDRLNGDFALAVWDKERRELLLARDRFGVRPLFIAEFGGDLLFASEIKALLRHPRAPRSLDPAGVAAAFSLWTTLPDRTAFRGVRHLGPGCHLRIDASRAYREGRWWAWTFAGEQSSGAPAPALEEELRFLLADACRLRLRADATVGAYVSGGVDSSAIATLSRKLVPGTPLLAVGFGDSRFDESRFQDQVARSLDARLHRVVATEDDIASIFPEVTRLAETPLLRTAPAPLLLLSALAKKVGCKAVLTGEGADEMFAGYDIFKEAMIRRFWARQPDSLVRPRLLQRLYPYLDLDSAQLHSFLRLFFAADLQRTDDPLYSHRIRINNGRRLWRLFDDGALLEAKSSNIEGTLRSRLPQAFSQWPAIFQVQHLEAETFLSGYLLQSQGDRMLMGNSVEGRFPYLDHRIAEFAARTPQHLLLCGLRDKIILRRAVEPLIGKELSFRAKHPYRAPILHALMSRKAADYVNAVTDPDYVSQAGLFKPNVVMSVVRKCRENASGRMSEVDEMMLAGVVSTMLLHHMFVQRPTLAAPAKPTRAVMLDDGDPSVGVRKAQDQVVRIAAGV
jgi:asparagine synthase (glutamine-hydrolysing)